MAEMLKYLEDTGRQTVFRDWSKSRQVNAGEPACFSLELTVSDDFCVLRF